jgi:hypothetical protein
MLVLGEALAALASMGSTALVTAMVTDAWEDVRASFARWLGRGDKAKVAAASARLDRSRNELVATPKAALERTQAEAVVAWRARFEDLLEADPEAADELRKIIVELSAHDIGTHSRVDQHVVVRDGAQAAVQGQGVQYNSFGGQYGSTPVVRENTPERYPEDAQTSNQDLGRSE